LNNPFPLSARRAVSTSRRREWFIERTTTTFNRAQPSKACAHALSSNCRACAVAIRTPRPLSIARVTFERRRSDQRPQYFSIEGRGTGRTLAASRDIEHTSQSITLGRRPLRFKVYVPQRGRPRCMTSRQELSQNCQRRTEADACQRNPPPQLSTTAMFIPTAAEHESPARNPEPWPRGGRAQSNRIFDFAGRRRADYGPRRCCGCLLRILTSGARGLRAAIEIQFTL